MDTIEARLFDLYHSKAWMINSITGNEMGQELLRDRTISDFDASSYQTAYRPSFVESIMVTSSSVMHNSITSIRGKLQSASDDPMSILSEFKETVDSYSFYIQQAQERMESYSQAYGDVWVKSCNDYLKLAIDTHFAEHDYRAKMSETIERYNLDETGPELEFSMSAFTAEAPDFSNISLLESTTRFSDDLDELEIAAVEIANDRQDDEEGVPSRKAADAMRDWLKTCRSLLAEFESEVISMEEASGLIEQQFSNETQEAIETYKQNVDTSLSDIMDILFSAHISHVLDLSNRGEGRYRVACQDLLEALNAAYQVEPFVPVKSQSAFLRDGAWHYLSI